MLRQQDMLRGLHERGPGALVADVMQRDFQTAELGEMVQTVLQRLGGCRCSTHAYRGGAAAMNPQ